MTFILAIQLKDSIVIASDKRSAKVQSNDELEFEKDETNKLHVWENGVITGSGEIFVIQIAVAFLNMFENSNIDGLANYLELARLIRKQECNHIQIEQTKLIYSKFNNFGVQLYTIEDYNNKYSVRKLEENEITVWMYNPDLTHIIEKIQNLYSNLQPMNTFANALDWINYYLPHISQIYSEQSKYDEMMSRNFDVYFQTKENFYIGTFDNETKFKPFICG